MYGSSADIRQQAQAQHQKESVDKHRVLVVLVSLVGAADDDVHFRV